MLMTRIIISKLDSYFFLDRPNLLLYLSFTVGSACLTMVIMYMYCR